MGIGSVLVGVACILVVGAYLARPFRGTEMDPDRAIEAWVAQARRGGGTGERGSRGAEERVNFCAQCGRRVGTDDHFCPGCGTRLQKGAE
ncbi:MAG: zinc-ribbon domain-containing protein [Chloroflexota bacterium]|nr:zinc-ribbon domain-containing protein [Chloroflexota bacterium]